MLLTISAYSGIICCILSAFIVGLSGIVPLLFIPIQTSKLLDGTENYVLNRWLSYAIGSLLGEVFLHLFPETWTSFNKTVGCGHTASLWILIGILFFFMTERLASTRIETKQVEGYLNLFANVVDNFTHGVAIGGSYLVSFRLGFLTTLCILVHEVPHEMGDFVILLRNGFTRWQAAKAQLITASGSTFGAIFTLAVNSTISGWSTKWILPFTAGGFLYIALVSLVPDLLKPHCPKESLIHIGLIGLGLVSMFFMSYAFD